MGEKSLFMQDNWGSNHGYEAMLDFQMSWLMRLAAEKSIDKPRLHEISRDVLLRLIEKEGEQGVEIEQVIVKRQWSKIDVIAEVDVLINGNKEQHLVVIEDKAYTKLRKNQLIRYTDAVKDVYEGEREIHYWLITFFDKSNGDNYNALELESKRAHWGFLSFYDVIDLKDGFEPSESDLFNEFWLKEWY